LKEKVSLAMLEVPLLGLALSMAFMIPVIAGAGVPGGSMLFALLVISIVSVAFGKALAIRLRIPPVAGFSAAFQVVIGFSALSLVHLALTVVFKFAAHSSFLIDILLVAIFCLTTKGMWRNDVSKPVSRISVFSQLALDAGALLMVSVLTTLWVREAVAAVRIAEETGIFRAFYDFFLHASEVTYLRDYPDFAQQSLHLADSVAPFYHRAGYALSGVFSWLGNVTSLETATYFMMPAGLILCGFAAYGLGCALAGRMAGFAAAAALLMLPDASMYGLRNGFLGYHWLTQIAPTSGYAVSIILTAIGAYVIGSAGGRFGLVLTAAAIAASAAAFRIQIAILASLLFMVLVFINWRPAKSWYYFVLLLSLTVAATVVVLLFERITYAPHFLTGKFQVLDFFLVIHRATPSTFFYSLWTDGSSATWKIALGYALLLLASLGAILPSIFFVTVFRNRIRMGWRVEVLPFALLAVYLVLIIIMPSAANGDITEYNHRPFVLVYAVLLTFLMSSLVAICRNYFSQYPRCKKAAYGCVLILSIAGIAVPWHFGHNIQQGRQSWTSQYTSIPVSADRVKATRFIREHALPGDRVLSSDEDPFALTVALTEKQALVSRERHFRTVGGALGRLADNRFLAHRQLRTIVNFEDLTHFAKQYHVRWYLLRSGDMPLWSQQIFDKAVFRIGDFIVFDLLSPKAA